MCNCKNALNTVTTTTTSVEVNNVIPLNTNNIIVGQSIKHTAGSGVINFVKGGLYLVMFNASAAGVGNITVQMKRAGLNVLGASNTTTSTAETDIQEISFTALVKVSNVCPCSAGSSSIPIQFVNTGIAATYNSINVTVIEVK